MTRREFDGGFPPPPFFPSREGLHGLSKHMVFNSVTWPRGCRDRPSSHHPISMQGAGGGSGRGPPRAPLTGQFLRSLSLGFIVPGTTPGFPDGANGKEPDCQCRRHKRGGFNPWAGKMPWRRAWQPTSIFLPRESHRQRSLVGYSPQGCKESDMTEVTAFTHRGHHQSPP